MSDVTVISPCRDAVVTEISPPKVTQPQRERTALCDRTFGDLRPLAKKDAPGSGKTSLIAAKMHPGPTDLGKRTKGTNRATVRVRKTRRGDRKTRRGHTHTYSPNKQLLHEPKKNATGRMTTRTGNMMDSTPPSNASQNLTTKTMSPSNGEATRRSRDTLSSELESPSPIARQSSDVGPANDENYLQMSMMEMARHMFKFDEVRNALQEFDEELYRKIAEIISK
ncbi:hypothetical protein OSTOST_26169 [Ostertagia ostertagi]